MDDLDDKSLNKLSSVTDQPIQPVSQQETPQESTQQVQQQTTNTSFQEQTDNNNPFQNSFGIKKEGTSSVPQNAKKFSFL